MQSNKNVWTYVCVHFIWFMTLCLPLIAHNSVIDCEHAGMMTLTLAFICWAQSYSTCGSPLFISHREMLGDAVAVWISDMISTEERIFMN